MSYRDLRCRCCPSLNSFRVGRLIVCISPHPDLSAGAPTLAVSVTTSVFAPQPAEVVTPITEAALCAPEANPVTSNGGCPGTESTALELNGEYSEYFVAAGSPANAPAPERDDFGATNSVSDGLSIGSLPSGESDPSVTLDFRPSEFKSSDGPASISPGRIIREGRETASHVLAVARYPSSGQTFCIGCDAPVEGFFCQACEAASDVDLALAALEAERLRAPSSCGGNSVDVPAQMRGSIDCGLARDDVKPEDTTQGYRSARSVTCPQDSNPNPGVASSPPETSRLLDASEGRDFSFIDIPEFLPRKSSLLEMS